MCPSLLVAHSGQVVTEAASSMQQPRLMSTNPVELGRVVRDDSLLEHEATVEAPFAGLDHAIGFLREVIEGKSLDRAHRRSVPLRRVDLTLHLALHRGYLIRLVDDLHSQGGLVDKGIERQN